MKCPLLSQSGFAHSTNVIIAERDCLKEECAWWDKVMGRCCIPVLQTEIAMAVNNLANVFDRLPPNLADTLKGIASSLRDIASKTPLGGK